MSYKRIVGVIFLMGILFQSNSYAQDKWKKSILVDEFIFEKASFPQSHASTIAETPEGLMAAWFGGTKEGNKDVCIWTSHLVNNKWTEPAKGCGWCYE